MNTNFKTMLNAIWKVGLGLIGIGVAVFSIIFAVAFHKGFFGRWCERTLSPDIVVWGYEDNTVRIYNKATKDYTTKKILWVSGTPCEGDSLTVFCDKEGKRGFLNIKTGEITIPAQYTKAWNFSEGLAAVLGGNGRIGFINAYNQLVVDYIIPFEEGTDYIFKDGYCKVCFHNNEGDCNYALYCRDGSLALDWNHTFIGEPNKQGYRIVAYGDDYRILDRDLRQVLPEVYEMAKLASGNNGVYVTKNHIKQLLSFDGTIIEAFVVDGTRRLELPVRDDAGDDLVNSMDKDVLVYVVDGWEGLMDVRTGRIITPASYRHISLISKALIQAQLGNTDESVVLDKKGQVASSVK